MMKYRYPFTNEIVFTLVMQEPRLCQGLLQMIFPDRQIHEVRLHDAKIDVEKTIIVGLESRKVRLDVLFEGESEWYDIEMQVRNEENVPKRSRYAHGITDVNMLRPGQDFNELKPGFVIFLCCFDPFDLDEAVYRFSMIDPDLDLPLGDESYTIILNSKADSDITPDSLKELFEYMNEGTVSRDNELLLQIDDSVQSWNTGEGVNVIMTLEQEILIKEAKARKEGFEEGHTKGVAEGRREEQLRTARNLKKSGISTDIIANCTGLSISEIEELS